MTQDSFLNDSSILSLCSNNEPMIFPYVTHQVREENGHRVLSYGVCSYGYDIRLSRDVLLAVENPIDPMRHRAFVNDPKNQTHDLFYPPDIWREDDENDKGEFFVIPPHGFALGVSIEHFAMPDDVTGIAVGKSTYARSGIHVLITPLEAGWRGTLVIEIANVAPYANKVYVNEGIAQIQFHRGEPATVPYHARPSRYQDQSGVALSSV